MVEEGDTNGSTGHETFLKKLIKKLENMPARKGHLQELVVSDGHSKLLPLVGVVESHVAAGLHDADGAGG